MKLVLNISKEQRKEVVRVLEAGLGEEAKYLGTPTMAYRIGKAILDRDGRLEFPDDYDEERLLAVLEEQGIEFLPEAPKDNPDGGLTQKVGPSPREDGLTIEMPRGFFTDGALANLQKIVDSKASLIKKAVGADELPIEVTDEKVSFPWFTARGADEAKAYGDFVSKLSQMARDAKRVVAKEKEVESEKFAFRCFLLRLGFKGGEFKTDRRILLQNLDGPAAFPTKAAADAFSAKQKAKREEATA